MILKQSKEKKTDKFLLFLLLYLAIGWILYAIFGHQLIKAIYEGKSFAFLNSIITGQNENSLKYYFALVDKMFFIGYIAMLIFVFIFFKTPKYKFPISWLIKKEWLEKYTDAIDTLPDSHIGLLIALAAGLCLYIELMVIRFHSSCFHLFTYFKNISLLSCFLGLGIGYAKGSERPLPLPVVVPLLAVQFIFMNILRYSPFRVYLQNPISEQLTIGLNQAHNIFIVVFVFLFLALIFSFNALCFIPLGQLVSRLMMRKQNLISYAWNLIGSLLGIVIFTILSFLWTPPLVWFIVATLLLAVFFYKNLSIFLPSILALIIVIVSLTVPSRLNEFDIYSPYQILTLVLSKGYLTLKTSNTYYQKILNLNKEEIKNNEELKKWSEYYELPYYFKPNPKDVLVVGSGTGNDVAAALRNGAQKIDAVEIDPAILELGKQLHPESPYQANNVNAIIDDARTFIRYTNKQYDLIVYGLLDSHTLLSGKGNIRLDSYVYTTEAFRESRKKLKDGGIISLTFGLFRKELGRKLFLMLQEAFDGRSPIVYQIGYNGGHTFLCGDNLKNYSLQSLSGFKEVTNEFANTNILANKATDDWPFFYMPIKRYPLSYVVMILMLLAISAVFIYQRVPGFSKGFSAPCFFLGAGFMLLETKAITELALVYGSTWIVISIVIASILIMAFLANYLVIKQRNPSLSVTYGLIFLSLIASLGVTFINLSYFTPWLSRFIIPVILTFPLLFSGFAFSSELTKAASVSVALSSNLLGAMLGGFLEYNSMYFGYRSLYLIALFTYGFAFLGAMRSNKSK